MLVRHGLDVFPFWAEDGEDAQLRCTIVNGTLHAPIYQRPGRDLPACARTVAEVLRTTGRSMQFWLAGDYNEEPRESLIADISSGARYVCGQERGPDRAADAQGLGSRCLDWVFVSTRTHIKEAGIHVADHITLDWGARLRAATDRGTWSG